MKKLVIGYVFSGRKLGDDEKIFLKLAKKKKIELLIFNIFKDFDEKELGEKIKKCDIVYNSTAEDFGLEFVKTIEELGKKVIESSKAYYYTEDKWMFYLKCKEYGIPFPETILLSENENLIKGELERFNRWPVILKRIEGCQGEFVDKAENLNQAMRIIKKFWKKGSQRIPIIAQEFIPSITYRVTTIDNKIVQTIKKSNKRWKATGAWDYSLKKFNPDKNLRQIIKKLLRISNINICGIDLMKKNNQWLVLEVNSEPTFGFFEKEREKLINKTLNFLIKEIRISRAIP
jgi:RimK family alpha-L-glutamate ligase